MASVAQEAHLPALEHHGREEAGRELQATLVELVDLSLIGKQLHWNIFGTNDAGWVLAEDLQELAASVGLERVPRVLGETERIARPSRSADLDHDLRDVRPG